MQGDYYVGWSFTATRSRCNACWSAGTGYFGLSNAFGEDASDQFSIAC